MKRWHAGDFDYDSLGTGYSAIRRADPRIAEPIAAALGGARTVLNVGAGAGSYEPTDRLVVAVEPSTTMRAQRAANLGPALAAVAEALPFPDHCFDAVMASLTIHHWPDANAGLRELRRVSRGPVVILTFDGDAMSNHWLDHYSPEFTRVERGRFPPIDDIVATLAGTSGRTVTVDVVPIPIDCSDGFGDAFYGRPEAFLDPAVRAAQSGWGFIDSDAEERAVGHLRADLASGEWDRRYGHLRTQPTYLGAVRLITAAPAAG